MRSRWPEDVNRGFDRDAGSQPGESAPFTMKQSLLRWWMGSLWHCDPDALMVRRREALFRGSDLGQGLLSDDEAFVFTLNQYLSGGLVCFTEPMPELDPDRLALYRHILPPLTDAALPRDLFAGGRCPALLDTAVSAPFPAMEDWHTLTLFQWKDAPAPQQLTLDSSALGAFLQPGRRYTVSDLQSGRIWQGLCPGDRLELGVRPAPQRPSPADTPESRELPAILHMDGQPFHGPGALRLELGGRTPLLFPSLALGSPSPHDPARPRRLGLALSRDGPPPGGDSLGGGGQAALPHLPRQHRQH